MNLSDEQLQEIVDASSDSYHQWLKMFPMMKGQGVADLQNSDGVYDRIS